MNALTKIDVATATPVELPKAGISATEFMRMLNAGVIPDGRCELVDGDLQKMMPSHMLHGEYKGSIYSDLRAAYPKGACRFAIDLVVRIDEANVRGADIAVTVAQFPDRGAAKGDDLTLVVEIADTTLARDLTEKMRDYARAGVPDYWVVDIEARVTHVFTAPQGEAYTTRSVVRFGEPLAVPGTDNSITID